MTPRSPRLRSLTVQTGWSYDAEFIGYFVADHEGHYADRGLSTVFLEGGPDIDPESVVQSGQADIAISIPESTFAANGLGADLVVIGCQYRRNPLAIISRATARIQSAADLVGAVISVPTTSRTTFDKLLASAGVDAGTVTVVAMDSHTDGLVDGSIDAVVGFVTSMPIDLARHGIPTVNLLFDEITGLTVQNTITTRRSFAESNPSLLQSWIEASTRGWLRNFEDADRYPTSLREAWFSNTSRALADEVQHNRAQRDFMNISTDMFAIDDDVIASLDRARLNGQAPAESIAIRTLVANSTQPARY